MHCGFENRGFWDVFQVRVVPNRPNISDESLKERESTYRK
jgi:hypothetical protein